MVQRPHDPEKDKRTALRLAGRATTRREKAQREEVAAMRFAVDAGASLREVAAATGVPHVTVKRMLERSTADEGPCG